MYVVTGANGQTGGAVAESLLQQGQRVRVILRDGAKAEAWRRRGAETAVADLADADALAPLLAGASGAYLMTPPAYRAADPLGQMRQVAQSYSAAIARARPAKAVVLSSVGAGRKQGTGFVRSAHATETILRGVGIPLVFLRPAYFAENWLNVLGLARAQGILPSFAQPLDRAFPMVATRDIGREAATILQAELRGERVVELSGPRDESPASVAAILARTLGRPVAAAAVPRDEWIAAMAPTGFSDASKQLFAELYDALNAGALDFAGGGVERLHGSTTVEAVLAPHARGAAAVAA